MHSESTLLLKRQQSTVRRTIRVSEGSPNAPAIRVAVSDVSSVGRQSTFAPQIYESLQEAEAAVGHIISISILQGYVIETIGSTEQVQ